MKNTFLLIFVCFIFSNCGTTKEKTTNDLSFIDNRKMKYSYARSKIDTSFWSASMYIVVTDLTDEQIEKAKQITPQQWLSLLENEKTDYAADMILYHINRKSAGLFVVLNDFKSKKQVKLWKKYEKSDEIQYWKSYFEKQ